MPVIGVKPNTYKRLKIIRDRLHLKSLEDAIIILLDLYEDSILNPNEILINLLSNIGQLLEKVEKIEKKIESITVVEREVQTSLVTPVIVDKNEEGIEEDNFGMPSYLKDNPWVQILSRRGKERDSK